MLKYINKNNTKINYERKNIIGVRFMYSLAKKTGVSYIANYSERNYVTFVGVIRKKGSQKTMPHPGPLKTNPDGSTELRDVDHSGKNHLMLGDLDSAKNSDKINIYGTFTTKNTEYKDTKPTKVSDKTLDNQAKSQYLHEKENTRIEKNAIAIDPLATYEIQNRDDLVKHCNRIKTEQNLE